MWRWGRNIAANYITTVAADALALCVATTSTATASTLHDKRVLVFHEKYIRNLRVDKGYKMEYIFISLSNNSVGQRLTREDYFCQLSPRGFHVLRHVKYEFFPRIPISSLCSVRFWRVNHGSWLVRGALKWHLSNDVSRMIREHFLFGMSHQH